MQSIVGCFLENGMVFGCITSVCILYAVELIEYCSRRKSANRNADINLVKKGILFGNHLFSLENVSNAHQKLIAAKLKHAKDPTAMFMD